MGAGHSVEGGVAGRLGEPYHPNQSGYATHGRTRITETANFDFRRNSIITPQLEIRDCRDEANSGRYSLLKPHTQGGDSKFCPDSPAQYNDLYESGEDAGKIDGKIENPENFWDGFYERMENSAMTTGWRSNRSSASSTSSYRTTTSATSTGSQVDLHTDLQTKGSQGIVEFRQSNH